MFSAPIALCGAEPIARADQIAKKPRGQSLTHLPEHGEGCEGIPEDEAWAALPSFVARCRQNYGEV